jgi:putative flippase GtrA
MKEITDVLQNKKFKNYIYIGIINTIFGLAIFPILYFSLSNLQLHYLTILTLCYLISVIFAYTTNKIYVFKTSGNYLPELIKFSSYNVFVYILNVGALPALIFYFSLHPVVAQYIFIIPIVLLGYLWQSKITFKV